MRNKWTAAALLAWTALGAAPALAQAAMEQVPARGAGEGEGPYPKLVIRGAMMIPGDGGPARGPVDIVVERNRIAQCPAGRCARNPAQAGPRAARRDARNRRNRDVGAARPDRHARA